jgi:hexulose-6-phosphate isomerase
VKKGINIWSFNDGTPIKECMKIAKNAGFSGIELALNENGEVSLESDEKVLYKIKKTADEIGIELPSLASGLYWKYSLTSENKVIREKAKSIVKKQLESAAVLGADTILVVPGAVGVDFIKNSEIVSYDKAYDYALEALNELKCEAEKLKVSIGIENVWNKFLLSPLEMRDFIDKIHSEYVGSYFDVGNVISNGYPEQWIRILGNRIKKVHIKDFRRSVGNISGFVDLLSGDVNFREVVKSLNDIGYSGYVTAEMDSNYENQIVYATSSAMNVIFNK